MQNRRSSLEAATSTDSLLVATLNYPSTLAHDRQILILKNPISETLQPEPNPDPETRNPHSKDPNPENFSSELWGRLSGRGRLPPDVGHMQRLAS